VGVHVGELSACPIQKDARKVEAVESPRKPSKEGSTPATYTDVGQNTKDTNGIVVKAHNTSKSSSPKVLAQPASTATSADETVHSILINDSGSGSEESATVSVSDSSEARRKAKLIKPIKRTKPIARPISSARTCCAVETFAGCGRLAGELKAAGFSAIGIDYGYNKDKPLSKVINMDLSTERGQKSFWRQMNEDTKVTTFAPPCGTATRAREIRRKSGPDPKPLRTDEFPDGIPTLSGVDKERVESANRLYKFTAEAVSKLHRMGICWFIENPTNSLMWKTSWMRTLLLDLGDEAQWMNTQMCMHGG